MVSNFGTNGKYVCDFPCVNNSNLFLSRTGSKIWQIIGPILLFSGGGAPLFNALVWGEPLKSGLQNLASRNISIAMIFAAGNGGGALAGRVSF